MEYPKGKSGASTSRYYGAYACASGFAAFIPVPHVEEEEPEIEETVQAFSEPESGGLSAPGVGWLEAA